MKLRFTFSREHKRTVDAYIGKRHQGWSADIEFVVNKWLRDVLKEWS